MIGAYYTSCPTSNDANKQDGSQDQKILNQLPTPRCTPLLKPETNHTFTFTLPCNVDFVQDYQEAITNPQNPDSKPTKKWRTRSSVSSALRIPCWVRKPQTPVSSGLFLPKTDHEYPDIQGHGHVPSLSDKIQPVYKTNPVAVTKPCSRSTA